MEEKTEDFPKSDDAPSPEGKLILEATCTPVATKIPQRLKLLDEAQEKTEAITDRLAIEGKFGQGKRRFG